MTKFASLAASKVVKMITSGSASNEIIKFTFQPSNFHACFWSGKLRSLRWRHNGCHGVSNHQPHHYLLNRLFRCRSKKTSKLRVIGLCVGNSPVTGEFFAQMASNAENVSIWWRHILLDGLCSPLTYWGWDNYKTANLHTIYSNGSSWTNVSLFLNNS